MSTPAQAEFDSLRNAANHSSKSHPEDTDDHHTESDTSSDHDGSLTLHSSNEKSVQDSFKPTTMPTATYLPTTTQFDANTGPKGVIADARSFENARKRSFRQTLHAFTDVTPFKKLSVSGREKSKSPSPDLTPDEEEDEFMRQWRQKRFDELSAMKQDVRTRRQSPSKRRYGSLVQVDPAGYLDAVERVGADTVVVVLIYDDECDQSNRVEDALRVLAKKYSTTRFVRLHYLEAEMDEIAAPGVLAYRAGDCFANLVSFLNEVPAGRDLSTSTVEAVLERHKILL